MLLPVTIASHLLPAGELTKFKYSNISFGLIKEYAKKAFISAMYIAVLSYNGANNIVQLIQI